MSNACISWLPAPATYNGYQGWCLRMRPGWGSNTSSLEVIIPILQKVIFFPRPRDGLSGPQHQKLAWGFLVLFLSPLLIPDLLQFAAFLFFGKDMGEKKGKIISSEGCRVCGEELIQRERQGSNLYWPILRRWRGRLELPLVVVTGTTKELGSLHCGACYGTTVLQNYVCSWGGLGSTIFCSVVIPTNSSQWIWWEEFSTSQQVFKNF